MSAELPQIPLATSARPPLDDVITGMITFVSAGSPTLARDFADVVARARWLTLGRQRAFARRVSRHLVDLYGSLPSDTKAARAVLVAHEAAIGEATSKPEAHWPAIRLLTLAVHVLPRMDRARYFEEFRAELGDHRELSRRRQLAYGVRLVVRSIGLRRALRQEEEPGAQAATNT